MLSERSYNVVFQEDLDMAADVVGKVKVPAGYVLEELVRIVVKQCEA